MFKLQLTNKHTLEIKNDNIKSDGSLPDRDTPKNSLSKYRDGGPGEFHSHHTHFRGLSPFPLVTKNLNLFVKTKTKMISIGKS